MLFIHMFADVAAQVQTTTSTSVATPPLTKLYDTEGMIELVGAVIIAILTITGGILAIIEFFHKRKMRRKEYEREQDAPIVTRIHILEEGSKFFQTRIEFEREFKRITETFDHQKKNSTMMFEGVNSRLNSITSQLVDEQRIRAKIEAQVENINENIKRVESAIDRQGDRMEERFDRIQALFAKHT